MSGERPTLEYERREPPPKPDPERWLERDPLPAGAESGTFARDLLVALGAIALLCGLAILARVD